MLFEAKGICKYFGGLTALDHINFSINNGRIVSIIGPNGAGKTTFFNIISGYYQPDEGHILINSKEFYHLSPEIIAKRRIGRTFQNIRLFPELTAVENVLIGMHLHLKSSLFHIIFNTAKNRREESEALEKARELLNYTGLLKAEKQLARHLSYGDQRRLEIARALALNPQLLLLDEPSAGMNPSETHKLKELILQLRAEKKLTILLIEHDMKVVMEVSDSITVLNYGKKIAEGSPKEIKNNPVVIEAYLGSEAKHD